MNNYEIADHFSLLSKLMDIHGENSFKSKSYSIAAYHIEKLPKEIEEMDDAELYSQKGIGDSLGKKIREIQQTGRLDLLDKIYEKTPPGIIEMLEVKGLGPKKIAIIWKEMGIETIGELEYACNENRLASFKGFGAKTQQSILENILYKRSNEGLHQWAYAKAVADELIERLQKVFPENLFSFTGNLRRQSDIVEFLELLTDVDKTFIIAQFQQIPDTKIEEENAQIIIRIPNQPAIKIYFSSKESFYKTLFETTGDVEFLSAFLQQYSIPELPQKEEEIFEKNQLAFIVPALRNGSSFIEPAAKNALPQLIQPNDIKGIIHSHSTWSDGLDKLEAMAKAARDKGFEYLVISDHSQAAYYANGLKPDQIAAQHQEIETLNEKLAPFKIFKSIEADILGDGSLDYNEQVLKTFDLVIASVHSNLKMTEEKAMSRLLAAIKNPYTTILGHPTGRLLLSRPGYPIDYKTIIDACAEHKVVIEINAHPKRLDLDWQWIQYALEQKVLLSIDPDAHAVKGFDDVFYGVMSAQKGGLTAKNNLSSFSLLEFETFLKQNRKI